jgi:hypothetical protein
MPLRLMAEDRKLKQKARGQQMRKYWEEGRGVEAQTIEETRLWRMAQK